MTTTSGRGRAHRATSPFERRPDPVITTFAVGDRVSHDTYGLGWVTSVEAHATTVDFEPNKVRVTSPYTKLHKLEGQ